MRRLTQLFLAGASVLTLATTQAAAAQTITLTPKGRYFEDIAPQGAPTKMCRKNISEIGTYDPFSRRLFVNNYADDSLDIFDMSDPEAGPVLLPHGRVTLASLS